MNNSTRATFGSRLGMVLAAAGSAVGLANIWRFSIEVGNNGGAAFILVYIAFIILLGIPLMIGEFVLGRRGRTNYADIFSQIGAPKFYNIGGYMGVLCCAVVLSFYVVVAGWVVHYAIASGRLELLGSKDYAAEFHTFTHSTWQPLLAFATFLLLTHLVVERGVQSGIEKIAKALMPMFFIIIFVLVAFSATLPGFGPAVSFMFKADFSKITPDVLLSAMGQAFFSLSLGMGIITTYASYAHEKTKIPQVSLQVCVLDTLVAILSGLFIFPAMFSVSNTVIDAGPGLVFVALPNVFNMLFADMPVVNVAFSTAFYILLLVAAITSSISLHEVVTAFVLERTGWSRRKAATAVTLFCGLLGLACSLSLGPWENVRIAGRTLFDFSDYLTAKILVPAGSLIMATFLGWRLNKKVLHDEITNYGKHPFKYFRLVHILLKWVCPPLILLIFLSEIVR